MNIMNQFYQKNKALIRIINANFVIRVYEKYETVKTVVEDGVEKEVKVAKYRGNLVGGGQITKYMSEEDAVDEFNKALYSGKTKYTWWNRNKLRIEFVSK